MDAIEFNEFVRKYFLCCTLTWFSSLGGSTTGRMLRSMDAYMYRQAVYLRFLL